MFKKPLFILFSLATMFSQAQEKTTEAYYWSMPFRESPYIQIKGVNPMSAEQAKSTNHYRLVYDESNRLVEYSFRVGDQLKDPSHHWYTEPGFIMAPKTIITWQGNKEIRAYYNAAGKRISVGSVWEEIVQYNNKGQRVFLVYNNEEGQPAENHNGVYHYLWSHHDKNSVVESRFNADGKPVATRDRFEYLTVRLNYNDEGWLSLIEHLDPDGFKLKPDSSGAAQNKFTYDPCGNFIEWRVMDVNGNTVIGTTGVAFENQFYDVKGRLVNAKFFDAEGEQIALPWGPYSRKQVYDEFGNNVRDVFLDKHGNKANSKLGVAETTTRWSEDGVRLLEKKTMWTKTANWKTFRGEGWQDVSIFIIKTTR